MLASDVAPRRRLCASISDKNGCNCRQASYGTAASRLRWLPSAGRDDVSAPREDLCRLAHTMRDYPLFEDYENIGEYL